MKLSMLPIVERTVLARNDVLAQLEAVKHNRFVISIDGRGQDMALMGVAKPAIERELGARLAQLDEDLESYDVDHRC